MGGLGNQLFQYATARRLAKVHGVDLKLDVSHFSSFSQERYYCLDRFNIIEKFASRQELPRKVAKRWPLLSSVFGIGNKPVIRVFREQFFHFDPELLVASDNTYLDGYWQSERYFADIEDTIRKEFTVKTPPDEQNRAMRDMIQTTDSVSLHVRRGDYVTDSATNSYHGICDLDYYRRAISQVVRQIATPVFFVFSDDPEWVGQNLKIDYQTVFVRHNSPENGFEDLRLMSFCKHHIIANSTFSWWGAWLSDNKDKIVYAPKNWFAAAKCNDMDLIPATWHRC